MIRTPLVAMATSALAFAASPAEACPDMNAYGQTYSYSGEALYSPRSFRVRAGGSNSIEACGLNALFGTDRGQGWVTTSPDFSFDLSGLNGYALDIRVRSECDSVLVINTPSAGRGWYYDDDDGGSLDARIRLQRPRDRGWYDVWVGTHDGSYCDAMLTLETFRN